MHSWWIKSGEISCLCVETAIYVFFNVQITNVANRCDLYASMAFGTDQNMWVIIICPQYDVIEYNMI